MSRLTDSGAARRGLLKSGVLLGLGAALPVGLRAADQGSLPLIKKKIPSSGEAIAAIGIGTNRFRDTNYDDLKMVLQRMPQLGGSVIDTAAEYRTSESVIGRALSELGTRSQMFVSTKFNAAGAMGPGPPPPPPSAGGPPVDSVSGQASFDRSLMRLQTDHLDLLFAHYLSSVEPLMSLMKELKKAGKTRYIGFTTGSITLEHAKLLEMMQRYPVDFVQLDYSIDNREAATDVFPLALKKKIAIMIDEPLSAGKTVGHGAALLKQVEGRALPSWAADIDVTSWSQFFLKYAISHPAVTCVIPGSTKLDHLIDNQLAGRGRLPDAAMRHKMEAFWDAKA